MYQFLTSLIYFGIFSAIVSKRQNLQRFDCFSVHKFPLEKDQDPVV